MEQQYKGSGLEGKKDSRICNHREEMGLLALVRSMDFIEFTGKLLECFKQESVAIRFIYIYI